MTDTTSTPLKCVPATSRRRFLLGAAAVPVAAVAKSSDSMGAIDMNMHTAIAFASNISVWDALVLDYREKRADWADNCDWDDKLPELQAARASLPPKPIKPEYVSEDISHLTLKQIMERPENSEYLAAMEAYETDNAAWEENRAAVLDPIRKPAATRDAEREKAYTNALDLVIGYRITTISQLREKLEIISEEYRDCEFPNELVACAIADAGRLEQVA